MSSNTVELPYKYYPDPTKGKAVYLGYIYVGKPNTDPEVLINRKVVNMTGSCVCPNEGTEISQPIRTSAGGIAVFNGDPVVLHTAGNYSIKVLNSKMEQVYYDGNAKFNANGSNGDVANFPTLQSAVENKYASDGGAANLAERTTGNGGGAMWDYVDATTVTVNGFNIIACTGSNTLALVLRDTPTIPNCGGIANGVFDNAPVIQHITTISNSLFVKSVFSPYKVSTVALPRNFTLYGNSKFGDYTNGITAEGMHFEGDGVNPTFTMGDGVDSTQRRQTIRNLRVFNDGAPCLRVDNAPEWAMYECLMRSENIVDTNSGCVVARFSYRAKIKDCNLSCTGGGWAITAMNNMNGFEVHGNTMTGGGAGGAVTVGQSQSVAIRYNILEASLKSIYVGSDNNPENGLCSGIDISDNYIEQTRDPIHIGTLQIVRGGKCVDNYIGNTIKTSVPDRDATIKYGRIQSFNISYNSINVATDENVFEMIVNLSNGQIEDNSIMKNRVQGTPLNTFVISGAFGSNASVLRDVGGDNYFDFMGSRVTSQDFVEFISRTMTCNATLSATSYLSSTASAIGGRVLSVEIIEATGALDGLLRIGRIGAQTETVDQDLSLLTLVDGGADVALATTSATLSTSESNTIRLTAGILTSTFRFRIRYKAI